MANILGQLLVELGINTAAFKGGLDKATFEAKAFANQVQGSFSALGDSLGGLIGQFAGLSPALGGALAGVTSSVAPLLNSFKTVGGAAAGIGVAFAAAGIGVIGIAANAVAAANRLDELSQSTGVAANVLSGLGLVAAIDGVSLESLSKGLEKMGKSAFAAANASATTSNAYKTLGIEVKNTDGSLKNQSQLFEEVGNKFSTMRDGTEKTALAMQIFGRAGAELIPVLNRGGDNISELLGHFEKLGAVMDGETAAAASRLEEKFALISATFTGVQNKILTGLAPALGVLTDQLVGAAEDSQSQFNSFLTGLIDVGKGVINVFQGIAQLIAQIGIGIKGAAAAFLIWIDGATDAANRLKHLDFSGANKAIADTNKKLQEQLNQTLAESGKSWDSYAQHVVAVWTATNAKVTNTRTGAAPAQPADVSFVTKAIQNLEQQAKAQQDLAQAIGKTTGMQIEANAVSTANLEIQKLIDTATLKGIQNTSDFKNALAAAIPRIQAAAEWMATFKAAIGDQAEFDKFTKHIAEQVQSLQDQAAAGSEVEKQWAKNNATLKPLNDDLSELIAQFERLRDKYGDADTRTQALGEKVSSLATQYNKASDSVNALNKAFQDSKAADAAKNLDLEIAKLEVNLENLKSVDSFYNIAQSVIDLKDKIGLTDEQVSKLIPKMNQLRAAQVASAVVNSAKSVGFDPKQVNDLNAEITYLQNNWKTLGLSAEQYSQLLTKLEAQYADLQAQGGGFTAGIKAGFKDFQASIISGGQLMQQEVSMGLKGISDNFADMVATGKAKWGDLVTSMETALLKSSLNNIINSLFGALNNSDFFGGLFGGNVFGSGGLFGGGHAAGGDVTPGKTYLVGEKGPELLTIGASGGHVIPNGQFGGGGGGGNVTVIQNIKANDADSFQRSSQQIQSAAYRQAASVHARLRQ